MGGRLQREWIQVYLWLIHVVVRQKPTQHCKAIILQLKKGVSQIWTSFIGSSSRMSKYNPKAGRHYDQAWKGTGSRGRKRAENKRLRIFVKKGRYRMNNHFILPLHIFSEFVKSEWKRQMNSKHKDEISLWGLCIMKYIRINLTKYMQELYPKLWWEPEQNNFEKENRWRAYTTWFQNLLA